MNKIVWVIVFTIAFVYGDEESSSSSSEENLQEVASYLKGKFNITIIDDIVTLINKTKEQCPDIEDKLETAIEEIATCIDEVELGSDTVCSIIRNNFVKCAEPARKITVDCLPTESKDLPAMVVKIVLAIFDQACNSTVEQIIELFNPCIMEKKVSSFEACTKVKDAFVENRNKLPSKNFICKMIPKLKECTKSRRDASCTNPVTKQALVQFYEAVDRATAADCQEINKAK